jgi:fatty-acyl-CoA synthase
MRRDEQGYYYFVDRIGDTYRWKGENVSTAEVAEAVGTCPGVLEAVIYGVPVPGTEGRAGMAALVVGRDFDMVALRRHMADRLPEYARPLFLRLRADFDRTTTFRPKKQDLAREGYDPAVISDALYVDDRIRQTFVTLDAARFQRIRAGDLRL